MTDQELSPEEKDRRASEQAEGRVDEFALLEAKKQREDDETPSTTWIWVLVAGIVLVALAGGAMVGFIGGLLSTPDVPYDELLGATLTTDQDKIVFDDIIPGGPVDVVGITAGDELLSIDGKTLKSLSQAKSVIESYERGDEVKIVVRDSPRPAAQYTIVLGVITIVEPPLPLPPTVRPPNTPQPPVIAPNQNLGEARLGIKYRMLIPDDAGTFDADQGAMVLIFLQDGSPAELAGLKIGDIIVEVGRYSIFEDFTLEDALMEYSAGQTVPLVVWRDGEKMTFRVTLGSGS